MYAKFGAFARAHQVLSELPMRNVVSWSALIAGYTQHGQGEEALKCFDDMLCDGHTPDAITFICVLKACGSIGAAAKGEEIHGKIVSLGMLEKDVVLGATLVDMYAKCGAFRKAHQVLKELPMRNVVSWSAVIAGYAQHGEGEVALECLDDMLHDGHSPDAITFICVLKACGSIGATAKGEKIHDEIVSLGMLEKDVVLGNALVDMYAKCGAFAKVHRVLQGLPMRNVVSWSALIAGYTQHGQGEQALKCFDDMLCDGQTPDAITFICVLKACGSIGAAAKGEEIHEKIVSSGMLDKDTVLVNTLVGMYAKCGALAKAHQVLKEIPMCNVVSWTALIAGYAQHGQEAEVLKCFNDMLCEGHFPIAGTFVCALKACKSIREAAKREEIHDKILSSSMLEKGVLGLTVVDMYAKCSALAKAHLVLKELPIRNIVSWIRLITGYMRDWQGEEALEFIRYMLCDQHSPDAITFASLLMACGSIRATAKGGESHDKIVSLGMLEKVVLLGNTLLHMYVKCGTPAKAQLLKEFPLHNVVCWNALIAGYTQQGQSVEAINCFEQMQAYGVKPDLISLSIVLNACSHAGLLDQAETYFSGMSNNYGIHPSLEHYGCMIDVFGRAGKFNKVLSVIAGMPNYKCLANWVAVLGACRKWAEVKIGALAFKHALDLDKHNPVVYVIMADIYTAAGMQAEVHTVEVMRVASKAWKNHG